jgi:putative cell wall-binding protein
MGMTAGVIGVTAGVAGATTSGTVTETGVTTPLVSPTGATQHAGNLKLVFATTATTTAGTLTLTLPSSVVWEGGAVTTTATSPSFVTGTPNFATGTDSVTVSLKAKASGTVDTLEIKTIVYKTTSASGAITATPTYSVGTLTFTTTAGANAYAGHVAVAATSVPHVIGTGPAGTLKFTFPAGGETTAGTLTLTLPTGVEWKGGAVTATSTSATFVTGTPNLATGTNVATVALKAKTTTTTAKVLKLKTIVYDVGSFVGAVDVTPTYSHTQVTFTPTTVENAIAVAAGSTLGDSIVATSAPSVPATGSGNAAGNLTIHLRGHEATATTTYLRLKATSGNSGTTHVTWASESVSSSGISVGTVSSSGNTLVLPLGKLATGTSATIKVTGVTYNTATAQGTIKVTPRWHNISTTATYTVTEGTFTPSYAVNAKSTTPTAATAPAVITVKATTTPAIGVGMTNQAVGSETLTITGKTTGTTGWTATGTLTLTVTPGVCTIKDFIAFDGTPTVTFTSAKSSDLSTTPKVTASLTHSAACATTGKTNELKLTFTNAVTIKKAKTAGMAVFTITGIHYSTGATNPATKPAVTGTIAKFDATTTPSVTTTTADNAYVTFAYLSSTPVTVTGGAYDHSITPVKVVESKAGTVKKGWVCLALTTVTTAGKTASFNTSATPSVKVTSGNAVVASTVEYLPATGAKRMVAFHVTTASSTTKPSTYTLSGLALNAPAHTGQTVKLTATDANATTCTGGHALTGAASNVSVNTATVLSTRVTTTVIYGATADATAVKELETRFPTTSNTSNTTPTRKSCPGYTDSATATAVRPVILATTKVYQDALSSSYLAGYLNTGTLLTPTTMLSTVTKRALRTEGVTQVYVVGGPLAITTAVVNAIKALPAYSCGGVSPLKTGKTTVTIQVTRIYGQTQYGTAERIAETVPATRVSSLAFADAYAGVNATKGDGMYNTTAGMASTAPLTSSKVATAILASGTEFQDAMAASAVAYGTSLPVLLTMPTKLSTQAANAIATLGIKQVVLMGGQLAVSNTVVKQLQSMGISVLRIAGKNYTGTAVQLAMFEQNTRTKTGLGWPERTTGTAGHMTAVFVARGNGFTDALAGAVLTGHTHEAQLLTLNPTTVGSTLTAFLKSAGKSGKGINTTAASQIGKLTIFGGPLAVTPTVIKKMETDIS